MSRSRRIALLSMSFAGLVLGVSQFALIGLNSGSPEAEAYYWRVAALSQATIAVVFIGVGLFLARRRPENAVGWLVASIGLAAAWYQAVDEYAVHTLLVDPGVWPLGAEAAVFAQVIWAIPYALIPILLLVYPTGRLLSPRWRWAVGLAAASAVVVLGAAGFVWDLLDQGADLLTLEDQTVSPAGEVVLGVGLMLQVLAFVLAVASLVLRWLRAGPVERLQIKWLLAAGLLLGFQAVFIVAPLEVLTISDVLAEVLLLTGLVSLPFAIAVAVMRYRLYEIDRIVSRTVTYTFVVAILALVYGAVVFLLRELFPFEGPIPVAVTTVLVAAMFNPLRRRVQVWVERRFNRRRYDAQRVVEAFTGRLREAVYLDAVTEDLSAVVATTVEPATASVWLR